MPGINGRVLAGRLLASRRGLKVLFISGYTDNFIAVHGVLERGMALLNKPYTEMSSSRECEKCLIGVTPNLSRTVFRF